MRSPEAKAIVAHFAHILRVADLRAYNSMVEAFDAYATEVTVAVTSVPQHEVFEQRGRAQLALSVLELLRHPENFKPKEPANG